MEGIKRLRYLAPNLITLASLLFGMLSIRASLEGRFDESAWFIIFAVLTDKLDGFVARLLKAASEFGVQADSFADFLNFGIAPALLWASSLSAQPDLPFHSGRGYAILMVVCGLWVLAVAFRLSRYNIVGDDPKCRRIFFGVPTTLMGGTLVALFLTGLKYGDGVYAGSFDEPHLMPGVSIGRELWLVWPALVFGGAVLMASAVKIPKLGLSKSKALTVFIFANVFLGYGLGFTRHFPEYLTLASSSWIVVSIVWGFFSPAVRTLRPPSIFPREDRPPSQMPQRPEEDAVPDEEEDEAAADTQLPRTTH
jgi:CDP-diacylglycerol---serine O-phosphatidyltransferase